VTDSAQGVVDPATLLKLIEDSGYSFPVIEEAVKLLRRGLACLDLEEPALLEILRQHLLAVSSPTDVSKYFSLELLRRASERTALDTMSEVACLLARSPLVPERPYHVERAMIRALGQAGFARALPALAVLAGRGDLAISRTAAKAVCAIVGSEDAGAIAERLSAIDLPEASEPRSLAARVVSALESKAPCDSEVVSRAAVLAPPLESDRFLRPEPRRSRQARLRSIVRGAGRDPARCGNCDLAVRCTVVHVVPPSRGGTDRSGNLVPLCATCRSRLPRRGDVETPRPARAMRGQMPLFG
jgi:5-methylcytosine-specific restriction endonuclease McrA